MAEEKFQVSARAGQLVRHGKRRRVLPSAYGLATRRVYLQNLCSTSVSTTMEVRSLAFHTIYTL